MLLRAFRLQPLSQKPHFRPPHLQSLTTLSTAPHTVSVNDIVVSVSSLIKKPNWQKNSRLGNLVSHLSPHLVSRVIASHSGDVPLCLNFFKWACQNSTYCYDINSRIQLLHFLASDNLWGVMHKVLIFLIKECCSSQDDVLKLICAVEEMRDNVGFRINYPCYSMLLMCLAKLDLGLIAFSVFKRMLEDGFVVSEMDYRMIVNALCKNGFVQAAEMFVSRALKLGFALDVHICTSLVLGNCRAREVGDALKVFALMLEEDGCGVNSVTYAILVHGLCEVGRLDEAFRLKEEMSKNGYKPSTHTYTVLIKAMCDKGLMNRAFDLLDEMMKKGCKPNVYTYTVLVDMLCIEGKIEEANGMFRKMLKDKLNPGIVTYNALINCYCKEGCVVLAFELLGLMERRQCKPNIRTYNELMEGFCNIGRPHKAVELLRKVMNNGLFPTGVTFNILISGFCRAGQLTMAFKILHSMSSIGLEPDQFSYTAFIDSLCKMGRPELAGVFLGLIIKKGIPVDEVMLTALIHGYCKTGKCRNALMLMEEMVKDGCLTGPHAFNIFLDVLGKEVKLVEENAMLGKMLKHGAVPSVVTYTSLVDGLCRAGDTATSLEMLELMKQVGCPPNIYTYTIVINGLCRSGKMEDAENLVVEMRRAAVSPNSITYALLIKSYVAARRLDRAFEIVRTMFLDGCRPNNQIYSALLAGILALENAGLNDQSSSRGKFSVDSSSNLLFMEIGIYQAFQLLHRITDCGCDPSDAYNFLIIGLSRTGRIQEADILVQQMVSNRLTPNSDTCASMITHFCRCDDYTSALEWMKRFVVYGCVLSIDPYCSVIIGLRREGRIKEAESLIYDLLSNAGVEDQRAVLPYLDFLVKGEEHCQFLELLKLIEQMGCKERPVM
ncbi:hypothetical protein C2S51_023430 [Perilla frutescens var. frutescens]|nr:hypothetical protein C2S51_023430 [Perilla frutescens var. frutescens]